MSYTVQFNHVEIPFGMFCIKYAHFGNPILYIEYAQLNMLSIEYQALKL